MNKGAIQRLINFFKKDIWEVDFKSISSSKRFLYKTIKVTILAAKGVQEDKIALRASALTYFSLLSFVPLLAIAFALAKGFGLDKVLEDQLLENFEGQEQVFQQSLNFAHNLLDSTSGGLVAGFGVVFLFYSVMKLLSNIEESFNDIWYVHQARDLTRKLTDYITVMIFGFILIIVANGITTYLATQITELTEQIKLLGTFKGLILPTLRILPFALIWLLFTLLYMIMPNTKVSFKAAVISGIVAGTIFQFFEILLFKAGIGVSRYNAIYGSFAALPLFLLWLQTSWIIVLFGSEIAYSIQNIDNYESNIKAEGFSLRFKKKVAIAACIVIIDNFRKGKPALNLQEVNEHVKVPAQLLYEVLGKLINCGVLSVTTKNDLEAYQPAVDTDLITIQYILSKYESHGKVEMGEMRKSVKDADNLLNELDELIGKSKMNKLIKEFKS
ncbi:YihY/virulence factor BrkB family protein [Fulvivirga lutea]|uniref:YihY/virulence factor BrkB family protein n=1 Tax=Fulvivirga lutea TaxID=2810512 RepID=A0A975A2S8_9BACT|nr:YihY/virulence factor BrkB family protein [Fulvivirga lutea]QSE99161.1 YihY/virulence factor BrkB family protein [Fulvivirga lutea]